MCRCRRPGVAGKFGVEALPAVIAQRRQNRGMEAIAIQNGKIYAFVQSPIRNPATLGNGALNAMQNVRLVEFDPATRATRQFVYIMDNPPAVGADDTRADKIGDMVAVPGGGFLVVERDDDSVLKDAIETITKKVYAASLDGRDGHLEPRRLRCRRRRAQDRRPDECDGAGCSRRRARRQEAARRPGASGLCRRREGRRV